MKRNAVNNHLGRFETDLSFYKGPAILESSCQDAKYFGEELGIIRLTQR